MSFLWPWMLLSLLMIPILLLLYRRVQRGRQRFTEQLGSLGFPREKGTGNPRRRRHLPRVLFLISLTILLLSTARPEIVLALPQIEGTVMLVFDVSASMAAEDIEPTRLEAAKSAAKAFIETQPSNTKVGVVSFSAGGLVVQTPSDDWSAVEATIDRLVPQSGTSLGQGILAALNAISLANNPDGGPDPEGQSPELPPLQPYPPGTFAPAIIMLLSDGENTDPPDPLEAAQAAIDQGVRVYTVGVGSPAGTAIEIEGFTVFTRLNDPLLKEIALLTEAQYFAAEDSQDLTAIYDNLKPQFTVRPQKTEITSILAGISLVIMAVSGLFSMLWFGRIA